MSLFHGATTVCYVLSNDVGTPPRSSCLHHLAAKRRKTFQWTLHEILLHQATDEENCVWELGLLSQILPSPFGKAEIEFRDTLILIYASCATFGFG